MKPSDTTDVDTRPRPTREAIATRAHELWLKRDGAFGDGGHEDDWRRAEEELLLERDTREAE